ncbi:signal peptidase I [uncultured Ruminococcus sp.]|uniref:signal peptidase I n=1 Tax=uncultured Ruminococcus sp. TaxID=165186 RepID=UPI00263228C9|nr:signal peptidase I [uncultured Ruminococcus sp.]
MEENNMLNETEKEIKEKLSPEQSEKTEATSAEPVKADKPKKKYTKKTFVSDVLEIAESTLITIFVIVLVFTYLLHPVNIVGHSMEPTLYGKDRIFMTTVYFGIKDGDILVIDNNAVYLVDDFGDPYEADLSYNPIDECIIKRVIACGGEEINIDDSDPSNCKVMVNGKEIDEPYIKEGARTLVGSGPFSGKFPFTVPEGYYFVMGDNRENSSDSRSGYVGLIKKEQIYGKAVMRYSPLKEMKTLFNSYKKSSDERSN